MTAWDTLGDGPKVLPHKSPGDLWGTGAAMFSQRSQRMWPSDRGLGASALRTREYMLHVPKPADKVH